MKLLLLLASVVAAATAASAASFGAEKKDAKSSDAAGAAAVDNAVHPDAVEGVEEGAPRYDHHYYCCYRIKKELENRMDETSEKIVVAFLDTKRRLIQIAFECFLLSI